MTVAELIKELQKMPEQDVEVFVAVNTDDDSGDADHYHVSFVQGYPSGRFPGHVEIKV